MEEDNKTAVTALHRQAARYTRSGALHRALQCYAEVLARAPDDEDALRRYSALLEEAGSPEELEEFCARAHRRRRGG